MSLVDELKDAYFKQWEDLLEKKLGHKVCGIKIFKDTVEYMDKQYLKSEL